MTRHIRYTTMLFALAGLTACAGDSTAPVKGPFTPSAAVVTPANGSGRYVVSFSGGKPSGFEAKVASLGGQIQLVHSDAGIAIVKGLTDAAATQLGKSSGVDEIELDASFSLSDKPSAIEPLSGVRTSSAADPTGAILFARQWDMRVINAQNAWAAGKLGSTTTRVAILDTGVDYSSLDLNGHVDVANSISFVPSDDSLLATYRPGRLPIADLNGHGTNVASVVTSNGIAFAGVTSKVTIFAVKVLDAQGSGFTSGVLSGILFAADHNADVINMSLGGSFPKAGNGRLVKLINKVFNYTSRKGTLVVVAAGNEAEDLDHNGNTFAAYCDAPHVVCVSATGPTSRATVNGPWTNIDAPAFYTNFGKHSISVAAPGGNGNPDGTNFSFVYSLCSHDLVEFTETGAVLDFPCSAGNFIIGYGGTSQASPHAAGLAALLVDKLGHNDPARIRRRMENTADDLGPRNHDPFYGEGRINVKEALGL